MKHYFKGVNGLGNVAISRQSQRRAASLGIPEQTIEDVLLYGADTPDGMDTIHREGAGIRLVILRWPTPFRGAKLVKTIYRIEAQAEARRR